MSFLGFCFPTLRAFLGSIFPTLRASPSTAENSIRELQDFRTFDPELNLVGYKTFRRVFWASCAGVSIVDTRFATLELQDLRYNDSIYKLHIPLNHKADIIFFHDIQWTRCEEPHVQTWMSSSEPPVCWPKVWLRDEYPEARILSARYDAGRWKGKTAGHMKLHLLAENLKRDILSIYTNRCPVFLVGHGLGGIVIKTLIRYVQQRRDEDSRDGFKSEHLVKEADNFLKNVKGILYFSTPFLGTKLAELGRDSPENGAMLSPLELLSDQTCHLNEWFRRWRRTTGCIATSIFATRRTQMPPQWYGYVVEEASVRLDVDEVYSSDTNHLSVCKFGDKTDSSFQILKELIKLGIASRGGKGPVAQGDNKDELDCEELVNAILNELATIEGGDGFLIPRDDANKIRQFPRLWEKLSNGFKNVGLAETAGTDMDCESWQPSI